MQCTSTCLLKPSQEHQSMTSPWTSPSFGVLILHTVNNEWPHLNQDMFERSPISIIPHKCVQVPETEQCAVHLEKNGGRTISMWTWQCVALTILKKLTTILKVYGVLRSWSLSLAGKPVSVKQVNTRVNPLLPKLPFIPPGPNCGTWLWIMAHKAQLHCRLCIAFSPDPASVKSHALPFCNNHSIEPSHFEHFITCHTIPLC